MAPGERRASPTSPTSPSRLAYDPEDDLSRVAARLNERYGSLDEALARFHPEARLDLVEFEAWLSKWGLAQDVSCVELFDYIDMDVSFTIEVDELFRVLALPAKQIKQRQKEQFEAEINRIYEMLAKLIHDKLGTIEEYFARLRSQGTYGGEDSGRPERRGSVLEGQGQGNEKELSRAEFRRLARQIGLVESLGGEDMSATKLAWVFDSIDKDKTGSISLDELFQALCGHLTKLALIDIADSLTGEHGSVDAAFATLPSPQLPSPPSPAAAQPVPQVPLAQAMAQVPTVPTTQPPLPSQPGSEGVKDDNMDSLKVLLRRLSKDQLPVLQQEETLRLLLVAVQPFSQDAFKLKLLEEHKKATEARNRRTELEKAREEDRRKRLKRAFCERTKEIAYGAVSQWAKQVGKMDGEPEDVTNAWSVSARAGRCQAQLNDYVQALEKRAVQQENDVQTLREKLAEMQQERAALGTPAHRAGDATPMTPALSASFSGTPHQGRLHRHDSLLRQQSVAQQAARLVQAVSVGDLGAVERCLQQGLDPDAVAWGGITPLMTAARAGRKDVMAALLEARADATRTDVRGRTAVDHAFRSPYALQWLRDRGAPSSKDLKAAAKEFAERVKAAEAERVQLAALHDSLTVLKRAGTRSRGGTSATGDTGTRGGTPARRTPTSILRPALSSSLSSSLGAFGGGLPSPSYGGGYGGGYGSGCGAASLPMPPALLPTPATAAAVAWPPTLNVPTRRRVVQWQS